MVYWPLESLYYSLSSRGGQGWHQGEKLSAANRENCIHHASKPSAGNALASRSQGMLCSNFTVLECCDFSGPRPESSMGGPSRVGEGHPALAICPARPGKAVPSTSPEYWLQQPWSALRRQASQRDSSQLHGIWSTGESMSLPHTTVRIITVVPNFFFFVIDGNAFETSGGGQLHWVSRQRRPQPA